MTRLFRFLIVGCQTLPVSAALMQADAWAMDGPLSAQGIVFHDRNANALRDAGEEGLPGVAVSNGQEVVLTDDQGHWRIRCPDEGAFFVIKPSGWMTPLTRDNLPKHYYIHKPKGSPALSYKGSVPTGPLPESINFGLTPQAEPDEFQIVVFADPQPYTLTEVDYVAHDVVEELIGVEAAFGVTLGDIVGDDLNLFEPLNGVISQVGIPWYNIIGNHDINYDVPDDTHSAETFERVYGPRYYAFNYAQVHFIALDDISWQGTIDGKKKGYVGRIDQQQLEFIANDLKHLPVDKLIVLMMHIPLNGGDNPAIHVDNREALFALLRDRPHTFALAGHMHHQDFTFFDASDGWQARQPLHQVISGTVSGSWWRGAPDESGIPHTTMRDGTPNGYQMITFKGNQVSLRYKSARRAAEHQMSIYAPDSIMASESAKTEVLVNVFSGTKHSIVELRLGDEGKWVSMERTEQPDPGFAALKEAEQSATPPLGRPLPEPIPSRHLWKAMLPAQAAVGVYQIHIRETDVYGQSHQASRIIRIQ